MDSCVKCKGVTPGSDSVTMLTRLSSSECPQSRQEMGG